MVYVCDFDILNNMYDIIVIGSGISGLTCACVLGRLGKKVLVIEKHDRPGGCLHTFRSQGFKFSSGNHYIGHLDETSLKLIRTCGSSSKSIPGAETYIWNGDKRVISDRTTWTKVYRCKPSKAEALADCMWWIAFVKLAPEWLALLAWNFILFFHKDAFQPYTKFVSEWSYMQEGDLGCKPIAMVGASVSRHYMNGFSKLSSKFVYDACKTIRSQGGKVLLKKTVKSITETGVYLKGGLFVPCKVVISSAGALATCRMANIPRVEKSVMDIGQNCTHNFVFLGLKGASLPPGVIWIREDDQYLFVSHETQGEKLAVHLISEDMPHQDMLELFYKYYTVKDKEVYCDFASEYSVKRYLGRYSSYGLACTKKRFCKYENVRSLRPETSMRNLYLTGQDILMPGIASALVSAMMTCRQVEKVSLLDTLRGNDIMDRI